MSERVHRRVDGRCGGLRGGWVATYRWGPRQGWNKGDIRRIRDGRWAWLGRIAWPSYGRRCEPGHRGWRMWWMMRRRMSGLLRWVVAGAEKAIVIDRG